MRGDVRAHPYTEEACLGRPDAMPPTRNFKQSELMIACGDQFQNVRRSWGARTHMKSIPHCQMDVSILAKGMKRDARRGGYQGRRTRVKL